MTLDPAHRRIADRVDEERRRSEERTREARRLWQRERGRVKRRLMLPLLFVVFIVASVPVSIVGQVVGAPLVSVAATLAGVAVAVALYRLPLESPVWTMGSVGEPKAAAWLEPLLDAGFVVILDRTLPPAVSGLVPSASQTMIDSLVIGPSGAFLIEPTRWRGPAVIRNGRLYVGDTDRTSAAEATHDKAVAAAVVLDAGLPQRVPITPVICAVRGGVGAATTGGVHVTDGSTLGRWLADQPEVLDAEAVVGIASLADRRLPFRDPWPPV